MPPRVGIAGTGMLGEAVGIRLARSGFEVAAYNRTASRTAGLEAEGARAAATPAELAGMSDVIITVVRDAQAVRDVVFGKDGIVSGAHGGTVVADMSTVVPSGARQIAAELEGRGIPMVEVPVMGGPPLALEGGLTVMASGDRGAYDRCKEVIGCVSKESFFLGGHGTAHTIKLAMNVQIAMLALSLSEGITLARGAGADPEDFLRVLNATYFGTGMSRDKAYRMIRGSFEPTFTLENLCKDLAAAGESAAAAGLNLEMASAARRMFEEAVRAGHGKLDYTGIMEHVRRTAGP